MDPQNGGNWPQQGVAGPSPPHPDSRPPIQQRSIGNYPPNHTMSQVPPMQMPASGSAQQPNQGHYYTNQPASSPLPPLSGLAQTSPHQVPQPPAHHQRRSPPPVHAQGPPGPPASQQGSGYNLPAIGQAIQSHAERDRQYHEAELREMEEQRQQQQEHEYREQQRMAEQQRSPPSAHAGSLPLQQPIASRAPNILHGPNGLLNANSAIGGPPGAVGGHSTVFANGLLANDAPGRAFPSGSAPQAAPSHQGGVRGVPPHATAPSPGVPPQQAANVAPAVQQGQQPILNDALSYLDLVKVRFQDQPDVYNRFLDIMKDFKSQAIDTPGVIERVSTLFNGHPQLIEGFNTFLPPGYRIEAGWDTNDPNQIRVTTPMGTTTCRPSMLSAQLGSRPPGGPIDGPNVPAQQPGAEHLRGVEIGWNQPAPRDGHTEGPFSPNARPGPAAMYAHQTPSRQGPPSQYGMRENELPPNEAAALAHQQEQRGVSQLQNAVNVAVDSQAGRVPSIHSASIDGGAGTMIRPVGGMNGAGMGLSAAAAAAQVVAEKRGPVEFNHAISYVNKIKLRFASQPEVYKQFLEILQTYQRESKPIQDVYAQVTELFITAPDLLEDFKQFLPEPAAHAKSQALARHNEEAAMTSNVRGDASYISGLPRMSQTPKPDKMPPLGNFAPPSVSKDNKKRRAGGASSTTVVSSSAVAQDMGASRANAPGPHAAKKQKIGAGKAVVSDVAVPSPSLVPELPAPLPPSTQMNTQDALAWFERVKKYIANRQTYNEFLKLCNLFTQEMIDANTLVHKASVFIGQNADLMNWFKNFVQYSGTDEVIENRPVQSSTKVVLSNCRALGPSYRLLPKRERYVKCSGRDEMCHQVLNDEWASHPTWASEDSGFISHRKNVYEEALYRMEEERHDYDFNIETCSRTIQLLEPIVVQINAMDPEDRPHYKLPRGLGGQSEAIWQRVIKKLYDRPVGCKVVDDMFTRPTKICPVVLDRLKDKIEKWRQAQREWEKIWRDQTFKQFWKSLDHQGLSVKTENKRNFQPKALQTEIQARYEEQRRQKQIKPFIKLPSHQLDLIVGDVEVVQDACHMLLTYLRTQYQGGDQGKIETFLKNFIPTFFGLDKDAFVSRMSDIYSGTPPNEEEEEAGTNDEAPARGRRNANGKKNLLRGVLDPSKQGKKDAKEDSKESTPDVMSMDEDSSTQTDGHSDQTTKLDASESRWMEHPVSGNSRNKQNIKYNEPFPRNSFSLYANLHIYCFIRMLTMLYERLYNVKALESSVQEDVRRSLVFKPATELHIADKSPVDFFENTSPTANYYRQVVKMCEAYLERNVDLAKVEETLRRFYLPSGWQLYSFDKMLGAVVKFAGQVLVNDAKDRSNDIINLFLSNRKEKETTHQIEIDYRKQVEKLAKDSEVYRIIFNSETQRVTMQVFKKDDQTFDTAGMPPDVTWSYYVTAYAMRDFTEGVPLDKMHWPVLRRNIPKEETEEELNKAFLPMANEDGLTIRIAPNNYRLMWERHTSDWWVHHPRVRARGVRGLVDVTKNRRARFLGEFAESSKWMQGLNQDEIDRAKSDFGQAPVSAPS